MKISQLTRRDWLKCVGLGTGAMFVNAANFVSDSKADFVYKEDMTSGELLDGSQATPCQLQNGTIVRPKFNVPQIHETDVLVIGGGPAGTVAAIAAARAGVKTTIVERYGYFGGLSTGGLVLHILGHWTIDNGQKIQVCQGIGEEMMQRLEAFPNGIIKREFGKNPTIDAEAYKYLLVEMITEANIDVFLHSWAIDAIIDDEVDSQTGNAILRGVVIQTKLGPQAILARQIIDATGDGDVFSMAGAAHTQRLYSIGLPHRLGNLDRVTPNKSPKPRFLGDATPVPGVRWVNMGGPVADGIDVKTLSELELKHRKQIWKQVQQIKATPGYEEVYLMETASQIGVRITRVIEGMKTLTLEDARANKQFDDCIGVGGAWNGDHIGWRIPLGALLPTNIENLLTAGRSISGEPKMSDVIRVIPNCWVSGQGAGCAAAIAVQQDCLVRNVPIEPVQQLLKNQNAYLC
ncbi:MAG: FAD-dependent oxidoreductase [Planctomycetia bacterium]|nr:FAD-dependent oxidoreductase [Planctomycetia bacterium]